jgi:hypothetical protein
VIHEAAWTPAVPEPEATDGPEALHARVADPKTGAVDDLMKVCSLLPAGLAAHFGLSLRKVDRETTALVLNGLGVRLAG